MTKSPYLPRLVLSVQRQAEIAAVLLIMDYRLKTGTFPEQGSLARHANEIATVLGLKNIAVFAALRRVLAPKVRSQEPSAPGIWAQNVGSLATEVEEVLPVIACYHFVAAGKHFVGDDLRKVMDDYLATPADPIVETPITAEEFQEFILRMIEGACLAVFGFSATVRLRDPEHAPVAPDEQ